MEQAIYSVKDRRVLLYETRVCRRAVVAVVIIVVIRYRCFHRLDDEVWRERP